MLSKKLSTLSISPHISTTKLQIVASIFIAIVLLLAIVITGINLLNQLQDQDSLLTNEFYRSSRNIDQLHREVLRLTVLVNTPPERLDIEHITLQRDLVLSRITILQQRNVSEELVGNVLQIQEEMMADWPALQADIDNWLLDPTNSDQQITLLQGLANLEVQLNNIENGQEFERLRQYSELTSLRSQSVQFLSLASFLFFILVLISIYSTLRFTQERQNVLLALQKSQEQYRLASQAKSDFLSNMSHELRTPLNGILGYTQILQRHKNLSEKQREGVQTIQHSGEHLLALIEDILDISKIESRKVSLTLAATNLSNLLQTVVSIIRIQTEQKGLVFSYQLPVALPKSLVMVDEKRLRQILLNLLDNAIKFTDSGEVILRVTPLTTAKEKERILIRFEVIDTGMGIAATDLERLFHPFEQVGNTLNKGEGAGLGLAICQQLVHLMGGEIQVKSTVGKGSHFSFELLLTLTLEETTTAVSKPIAILHEAHPIKPHTQSRLIDKTIPIPTDHKLLANLYQLALIGDLSAIRKQSAIIANNTLKYKPFAKKLKVLATNFDDENILLFLEQCLELNQIERTTIISDTD